MEKIKAGVIGATGYAGLEIVRLLLSHPFVEVAAVSSVSFEGRAISEIYPQLTGIFGETLANDAAVVDRCDVVFGSLPAGLSEPIARRCFDAGKLYIDMGADFRLKNEADYKQWYGKDYADPALHEAAVYCIPELHRARLAGAKLIGNPGCYPTSIALGLAPAVKAGAKGIIHDGTGNGSIHKETEKSLIAAQKKGLVIVRSSRVGNGPVVPSLKQWTDEMFLDGDTLNAQKARLLLQLALTKTNDLKEIQRIFNEY